MGVGMVTDAHSGPRSRVRVLAGAYVGTGGPDVGAEAKFVTSSVVTTPWLFALYTSAMMILDGPGHRKSTAQSPWAAYHSGKVRAKNNK